MKWEIKADFFVLLLLLLLGDCYEAAVGYILSVLVHEGGHLAAIWLCGGTVDMIRFDVTGGVICYHGVRSYPKEGIIALSGAACNGLAALLLSQLGQRTGNSLFYILSGAQVVSAVFNLIPIPMLDGGSALQALFCLWTTPWEAETVLTRIGLVISFVLFGLGVYILIKTRYNGTMLLCGGYLFIACLRQSRAAPNCLKGTNPNYVYLAEKT